MTTRSMNPPWTTQYHCTRCDGVLSFQQMMCSHGCCPLCGHVTPGTVCDTVQKAVPVRSRSVMKLDHESFCRIVSSAPISPRELRLVGLFALGWFLMDAVWFVGTVAGWF